MSARSEVRLRVGGMWCASCARAVEVTLSRAPGVRSARVSLASGSVLAEGTALNVDTLRARVQRLGYRAEAWGPLEEHRPFDPRAHLLPRLVVALFFGMWVMALSVAGYVGAARDAGAWLPALTAVLATPVVWVAGFDFHRAAFRTLRVGVAGMDVLVSLGSLTAWGVSVAVLWRGGDEVWFDTATMLVVFLLLGRWVEAAVRARGQEAIDEVLHRAPQEARVEGVRCPAASVRIGQRIGVEAGEPIPLDGLVVDGVGTLDRALLTGESTPEATAPGERVHAGATLLEGAITVEVERSVGERRIDEIAARVRDALDQRTEPQRLAETFAERWVPLLILIALGAGTFAWASGMAPAGAALRAAAVLLVTCPCALSLAGPLTQAFAITRAARSGIVIRDARALERATRIAHVVFDKTGTLTRGRPCLRLRPRPPLSESELLEVAAGAEWGVAHPIAHAVLRCAHAHGISPRRSGSREVVPGRGVRWTVAGHSIWVGRADGVDGIEVARNGVSLGTIVLDDAVDEGAVVALAGLRERGLGLSMWSGDDTAAVRRVATALTITDARARLSPEDKASGVRALEDSGRPVAFVGDGVNDAPGLATAALGVAVQSAAAPAMAVAPVVLLRPGIGAVQDLFELAHRAYRVTRRNLGFAVVYNLAMVPLAAAGYVAPVMAPLAMIASSLTVTLNAATLLREPRPDSQLLPALFSRAPRSA